MTQAHCIELLDANSEDEDTVAQHFFLRKRGFTVLELLSTPTSNKIFKEDAKLLAYIEYIRIRVSNVVCRSVDLAVPQDLLLRSG
jgi:hypothetical protein